MNIVFRTDASHNIGVGHVMRCLTLAHALRQRGATCEFICREHPGHLLEKIRADGFTAIGLALTKTAAHGSPATAIATSTSDYSSWLGDDWQADVQATINAISEPLADWLIVDHYSISEPWEKTARQRCRKLMVIDDLANRSHDCDILLDQNLVKDLSQRYEEKLPARCGRLLGPRYALLQPLYAEMHQRTSPRKGAVRTILVYFGGADVDNLSGRTISAFLSLKRTDIALQVVIRSSSSFALPIRQQVKDHSNITVYEDLPTLAPLMAQADLAIGAGGATSWERCCLGLPALVITLADNQQPIAAELHHQRYIQWLGHHADVTEAVLAQAMNHIISNGLPADWSDRCSQLVDGFGAQRVVSILELNSDSKLKARLARPDDEQLILTWANDPLVRKTAFTPNQIDPLVHHQWFHKRLRDPEHCRLYVVETNDEFPLGQVRFDLHATDHYWEIGYALDPAARGQGLGKLLLQTAMQDLRVHLGSVSLLGRVKTIIVPRVAYLKR